jgi:gamma-glutamyltranspeptidase/glutathione hydrolase
MPPASSGGPARVTDYPRTQIDRTQGRSVVMARGGVVASEHPLASQAGALVLARGGHAVDAAIAANAVMGVVAPMMNGLGGDLFALVSEGATGALHGVNASGWSPAALTIDHLLARGHQTMPRQSIDAVTVPGVVAGWDLLRGRFGRLTWSALLDAAIVIAEDGFPVSELTAAEWQAGVPALEASANARATFLANGQPPVAGTTCRNPDLAWSYRQIASGGAGAFYGGDIARRIVACASEQGGVLSADDLLEFRAEWVDPIRTTYRGWEVCELPPNGQGVAALLMLNILEQFPLADAGHNSAEALHAMIEAKKLAYADMIQLVADPRFSAIPVADLLSKTYARTRAALIDPDEAHPGRASGWLSPFGGDTTYLSVVDRDGNMVSLIQSVFANFGSGLVASGTGFALQNRGGLFTLDPRHPNALAPRKRPLHTIIPGFMQQGDVRIAFGIMGGWNQAQAHAQFVSNVVDHQMHIQAALEAPRFNKLTFEGRDVLIEDRVPADVRAALSSRGHDVEPVGAYSSLMGGGQSVRRDGGTGVNHGASDPRKDGAAIPEPPIA